MINLKDKTILIISPHPDDEVFGCGGFIHRCKQQGGKVYVLYLTVGTTQDFSKQGISNSENRIREIEKVSTFLGYDGYRIAFPGNAFHLKLDTLPQKDIIHEIERGQDISLEALKPDIVLMPSENDYNQDHRAAAQATITATRPSSPTFKSFQKMVMTYELPAFSWSSDKGLAFSPNLYITLNEQELKVKLDALSMYGSQLKDPMNPLSLHGSTLQASIRGLQVGQKHAEAFFIKRLNI